MEYKVKERETSRSNALIKYPTRALLGCPSGGPPLNRNRLELVHVYTVSGRSLGASIMLAA